MTKVMIMANAPWAPTGYGVQGKHLAHNLVQAGHEVAYFAFYGLKGGAVRDAEYPVYPGGISDIWGTDILEGHMKHFGAETLITIMDPWVSARLPEIIKENGYRWIPWTPIDSDPISEITLSYFKQTDAIPLCYSAWGTNALKAAGIENAIHAPLGVSDLFKPLDRPKTELKEALGFPPDKLLIGIVGMNKTVPSRKAIPEQMMAFAKLRETHDAYMYVHTFPSVQQGGVDLAKCAIDLGIADYVRWPSLYHYAIGYDEEELPGIYNAFDFLSQVSMNEGFGVPLIEAQACGVPVVTGNWTSMPELCHSGLRVAGRQKSWTLLNVWVYTPFVDSIYRAYVTMADYIQSGKTELSTLAANSVAPYRWPEVIKPFLSIL